MEAIIQCIPDVPILFKKSQPQSYADSPFIDIIAVMKMPQKFTFPNMKHYDGTTDLDDYIASCKQRMLAMTIPRDLHEAYMCKSFGFSLMGPALQWYTNLPNNFIESFLQLMDTFVEQFASNKKLEKLSDDLYRIRQHCNEPLLEYVGRFNHKKVSIPYYNQETTVDAIKKGLFPYCELYKEFTKFNYTIMEDVLACAWIEIRWEEDEVHRGKLNNNDDCYPR
ncbi:uncharacterized protein LOC116126817 [Pistacia vera]|uniref:uncharacterized protein LOC116126817 n=1 Tax=Pistacia vera TaxID=55513 RepID=UPI0012638B73|nr:uncharacterized protein LOC116126817 [Pistacia vera]